MVGDERVSFNAMSASVNTLEGLILGREVRAEDQAVRTQRALSLRAM